MTDKQQLLDLLLRFLESGLVAKDTQTLLDCFAPEVLGIGLGEQGFVTNHQDIRAVMDAGERTDDPCSHHLTLGRTEIKLHSEAFATICAQVYVHSTAPDGTPATGMNFFQLLTAQQIAGQWKVCALHASAPVLTEEELESYPLRIADKTLQSLKKRIGDQAYQAEEQYRQAILSDTVAFYIVNFTTNQFEKCQCDPDLCAYVDEGDLYHEFLQLMAPSYLMPEDAKVYLETFALHNVLQAFEQGNNELVMDYQLKRRDGSLLWVQTVMRLVLDGSTNDKKGIVYVRNIDERKRRELELREKASTDGMTGLCNKATMIARITEQLAAGAAGQSGQCCCMAILDVDDFKDINDSYGHPVGDQALIAVAGALHDRFAASGLVARLGGDEFSIFLPDCSDAEALQQDFSNLLQQFAKICLPEAPNHTITCSIGAVLAPYGNQFEQLYQLADEALYRSKKNGKKQLTLSNLL